MEVVHMGMQNRRAETPLLVGRTVRQARLAAEARGATLALADDTAALDEVPQDARVTAQVPRPGAPLGRSRVVTIVVDPGSSGDREPVLPTPPRALGVEPTD
jgi:hypothetical protein